MSRFNERVLREIGFTREHIDLLQSLVDLLGEGAISVPSRSSDPTAGNGAIYYNSTTGKFRGKAAGSWVDLH